MSHFKMFSALIVKTGLILCLAGQVSWAQPAAGQGTPPKEDKTKAEKMTVEGCLAQSESANEYVIKNSDGKAFGLDASADKDLNLKAHVGHKVSVSGESLKGQGPHDDDRIRVASLKMISVTCP